MMKRVSFFLLIKGPSGPGAPARVQDPGADAVPHAGDRGGRGRRPRPLAVRPLQLCLRPPRHRLLRPILTGEEKILAFFETVVTFYDATLQSGAAG